MTTRTLTIWLSLVVVLAALGASAQTTPVDAEVGFRFINVTGNTDMYNTQINERNGFLIRALTLNTVDFGGSTSLVDYFRLDMSDVGARPAESVRIDAGKTGKYRLRVGYRQTNFFSALPEFANPLLAQGVIPGQHTYNRNRRLLDVDLDLLPNNKIAPFVGYTLNRYVGPGTTTVHLSQDEFLLDSHLRNNDQEVRAGINFTTTNISGSLTQGWRHFTDDESMSLFPGAGAGNNTAPVAGRDITASTISRSSHDSGTTPFTNFYFTGAFDPKYKLIGNYVRFAAKSNGSESENDSGSFASFALSRFFSGINEQIENHARNTTWRGGLRGEFSVTDHIDLLAGFQRDHTELSGTALINTLYLQSITFGGADPRDLAVVVNTDNALKRTEDQLNASMLFRPAGPFTLRAGVSQSQQDVTVTPDLAEIVVPNPPASQGGSFSRQIRSFDVLGTYAAHGFSLGASWKHDHADNAILRTDYIDRDRSRLRASWAGGTNNRFRVGLMAEETNPSNHDQDFQYNAKIRQYTGDAGFAPVDAFRIYGSASTYRANTSILFIHPETFAIDTSVHREDGKSAEIGATLAVTKWSLDASMSRFRNGGTYPFKMNRERVRATFDLTARTGIAAEWDRDEYTEAPLFGDFDANRYGIYFRIHP